MLKVPRINLRLVWGCAAGVARPAETSPKQHKNVTTAADHVKRSKPANWLNFEVGMARLIPVSQIATQPAKIGDQSRRPQYMGITRYRNAKSRLEMLGNMCVPLQGKLAIKILCST